MRILMRKCKPADAALMRIVVAEDLAVSRGPDVGLEARGPESQGEGERLQGVLGGMSPSASMGKADGTVEERGKPLLHGAMMLGCHRFLGEPPGGIKIAAWRLRFILLPALAPTTAFVLVIALIQLLTNVDHVIVLTKGGPSNSTKLVLYYIFEQAHENFAYGKAAAASVISVAVLLAMSVVSLKTMERGAHAAS